jgi:lipopolysaccharide biosynthesis regulator YciM
VIRPNARRFSDRQKELIRKYYFRGINYYSSNKFEKAISEWRKVLAIDPGHQKSKNNIRKCLILLRK